LLFLREGGLDPTPGEESCSWYGVSSAGRRKAASSVVLPKLQFADIMIVNLIQRLKIFAFFISFSSHAFLSNLGEALHALNNIHTCWGN